MQNGNWLNYKILYKIHIRIVLIYLFIMIKLGFYINYKYKGKSYI